MKPLFFSSHGDPQYGVTADEENGWMDHQHGGEETMGAIIG